MALIKGNYMNKRKSYLDELKHNASEQNRWQFCIQSLQLYFAIFDADNNTNHLKIINRLYVSDVQLTYDQIAFETGVSLPTLNRYIKRYDSIAQRIGTLCESKEFGFCASTVVNLSNLDGFDFFNLC